MSEKYWAQAQAQAQQQPHPRMREARQLESFPPLEQASPLRSVPSPPPVVNSHIRKHGNEFKREFSAK
jgi:hypothetical protein